MNRPVIVVAAAIALAGAVAACGSDGPSRSEAGFCATFLSFQDESDEMDEVLSQPSPDKADVKAVFDHLSTQVDALDRAAPSEIADDVALVAESSRQFVAIMERHDYDLTSVQQDQELVSIMSDPDVTAARDRVNDYTSGHCSAAS